MKPNPHHPAPVAKLPKPDICQCWCPGCGDYYEVQIPVTRPPSKAMLKAVQDLLEGTTKLLEPLSTARRGGRKHD